MEDRYQITPEMLGITWRLVVLRMFAFGIVGAVAGILVGYVLHRRLVIDNAIVGCITTLVAVQLFARPLSRSQLRVTDDSIETTDGPVIRRDAIRSVQEYRTGQVPGIEITGETKPKWLRKHTVFVPAALPGYEQIRQRIQEWVPAERWHGA